MTFNPPTLFIAHRATCRWHEIHSPTYATVWCVGLLPPRAALRLNQEQICKTSLLERWYAWKMAGQSLVRSLLSQHRVSLQCTKSVFSLQMSSRDGEVRCLGMPQNKSIVWKELFPQLPSSSPWRGVPHSWTDCQSHSHNPGWDGPLLSTCPAAHAALSVLHVQPWAGAWRELHAAAPWAAGTQKSEWHWGPTLAFTVPNNTGKVMEQKERQQLDLTRKAGRTVPWSQQCVPYGFWQSPDSSCGLHLNRHKELALHSLATLVR